MKQYLRQALPVSPETLQEYTQAAKSYAGTATSRADDFIQYLLERARGFSVFDFAMFKLCLLSFGIWLGALFSKFFRRFRVIVFLGFIASYIYLIWRIFLRNDQD